MVESSIISQKPHCRTKSRNKGINFNTVSPELHRSKRSASQTHDTSRSRSTTKRETDPKQEKPNRLHYEFNLPNAEQLSALSIDEQLRLLALKEMAVVEIKDGISDLEQKLHSTELDLAQLRRLIQRSLYMEMSVAGTANTPRDSNPPAAKETSALTRASPEEPDGLSTIWSNLAKPLTFIQQLDTLIQNEMEKPLATDDRPKPHSSASLKHKTKSSLRAKTTSSRTTRKTSACRPLRDTTNTISAEDWAQVPKAAYDDNSEDMFQAVSTSLWTFVNDVKTNMLASLNDTAGPVSNPPLRDTIATDHKPRKKPAETTFSDPRLIDSSPADEENEDDRLDLSMYSSMRRKKAP